MSEFLERVRTSVAAQPFTKLLGAFVESIDDDAIVLALPMRDELKQQYGFAHGGVLSYLADNALTIAGAVSMGGPVLTSEFKINYVRPAMGTKLIARAKVIYAGKRQAVCRCDVYAQNAESEKLVATAQGTIVQVEGV